MKFVEKNQKYGSVIIRIGISLVFLWFGISQLYDPSSWTAFVPDYATNMIPVAATTLVFLNGLFEVVFAGLLITGFFTRISALLLALHMAHIITVVGYNEIAVRDFGIFMGALSVFFTGPDFLTIDNRIKNSEVARVNS